MQKSSQNNSIKVKPEDALYVALEGAPNISLQEVQKTEKKCEEKDVVDGSFDDATKDTPLNLRFGSLRVLYISYSTEQTELLAFSNEDPSIKYVCG